MASVLAIYGVCLSVTAPRVPPGSSIGTEVKPPTTPSLIVFIDDATGKLIALHFAPSETTEAYMQTLSDYLNIHSRPLVFYSDRHSIFRVNTPQTTRGDAMQITAKQHRLPPKTGHFSFAQKEDILTLG